MYTHVQHAAQRADKIPFGISITWYSTCAHFLSIRRPFHLIRWNLLFHFFLSRSLFNRAQNCSRELVCMPNQLNWYISVPSSILCSLIIEPVTANLNLTLTRWYYFISFIMYFAFFFFTWAMCTSAETLCSRAYLMVIWHIFLLVFVGFLVKTYFLLMNWYRY